MVPCVGLTDKTWEWPRAKRQHTIANCISKSPTPYHGANRNAIRKRLFGEIREADLTPEQVAKLITALRAESTWMIVRHSHLASIHAPDCPRTIPARALGGIMISSQCISIKKNRSLIKAINHDYASREGRKFIPKFLMTTDVFHTTLMEYKELQILQTSLIRLDNPETAGTHYNDFWSKFAAYGKKGLFKDNKVFRGLLEAMTLHKI